MALTSVLCAAFLFSPQASKLGIDPLFQRLERTRAELSRGRFSPQSRALLEKAMASPNEGVVMDAEAKLQWAVQLGKYPKARLLGLIEQRTVSARFWWGVLLAGEYARTLGLKIQADPKLDREGLLLASSHEPANRLTAQDRAFTQKCVAADSAGGRLDALYALFPKQGLSKTDVGWCESILASQEKAHAGDEARVWRYAARVVAHRNAARALPTIHRRSRN